MKKLSLNETWDLCLKMWKWIAKEKRADNKLSVDSLKTEWLQNHGFEKDSVYNDCFFCVYEETHTRTVIPKANGCPACPGTKVDLFFNCMDFDYHYDKYPVKFYNKLRALNKIRMAKK